MISLGVYLYLAPLVVVPIELGLDQILLVVEVVPTYSGRCRDEAHCILMYHF